MTGISFLDGSSKVGLVLSTTLPLFASVYSFLPSTIVATSSFEPEEAKEVKFTEEETNFKNSIGFHSSQEEREFLNIYDKHKDPRWCKFYVVKEGQTKSLDEIKALSAADQKSWARDVALAAHKLLRRNINKACYEVKYGGKAYIEIKQRTDRGVVFNDFFLRISEDRSKYVERFLSYRK